MAQAGATGTAGTVTSADGTTIAYTKRGDGPAVVMIDGAFCYRDNGPSADVAPLLAQHFMVYTYDRRGRGASGDTAPYAVTREVEDVAAVMRQAGDSASLFGMSPGAALALHAASALLPIRKLVLYEPPYVTRAGGASITAMRAHLQALVAADDRAGAVRYFMREAFGAPAAVVLAMPLLMPGAWRKNKGVAHTLPYDFAILADRSVLNAHAASQIPTLVMGGAKSPASLRDAVQLVSASMPGAQSLLLPGRNHDLSAAAADAVPVLAKFYASPTPRMASH